MKDVLTSKKFVAALGSVIVAGASKIGLHLDNEALVVILLPVMTYIVSQGIADVGKERVKQEQRIAKEDKEVEQLAMQVAEFLKSKERN